MEFRRGCGSKVEHVTVKEARPYENRPYIKDTYYPASSSTRPYIVEPRQEPGRRDSFPPGYRSDLRERGHYADSSFTSPKIYDAKPRSPSPEVKSHARSRPPPSRSAHSRSESYYDTHSQSQSYSESKSYARSGARSGSRSRPPPVPSTYSHSNSYSTSKSKSQSKSKTRSNHRSDSISPPPGRLRRSTTPKHCSISPPSSPLLFSARHSDTHYQRHDSLPLSPDLQCALPPRSTSYSGKYKPSRSSTLNQPPQPDSRSKASKSARGPPQAPKPPPAASIPRRSTAHYETHNVFRSPSPKTKSQPPPKQHPEGNAGASKFDYKLPKNAIYTEWPVGGYTLPQEEPVTIPITPAPWNGNLSRISRYGLIDCLMKGSKRPFEETKELVDKQFALHAPIYWPDGRRSQSKYEIDEEGKKYEQEMKDKNKNKMS